MNATTGVASTAGKFASDFALGSKILMPFYPDLARTIGAKAADAYAVGIEKPGYCQTVSVRSPYIYEDLGFSISFVIVGLNVPACNPHSP